MSDNKLKMLLNQVMERHGEAAITAALERLLLAPRAADLTLTIVANAGVHTLPHDVLRGEILLASEGNLNLSSAKTLHDEYKAILRRVAAKLRERNWKMVYLIPTGPPTLSLQIKLLVYRITRLATVDVFYANGEYLEVNIDYRELLNDDSKLTAAAP